jgi:hypothetical protein
MDFSTKSILDFLSTSIGGVIIGWTLNELSQLIRNRQSDKRTLKKVLYNLLETNYYFRSNSTKDEIKKVTQWAIDKVPVELRTQEMIDGISTFYTTEIGSLIEPIKKEKLTAIKISYQKSIEELTSVKPILAYYLSGKTDIGSYFESAENWFDNFSEKFQNDDETKNKMIKSTIFNDFVPEIKEETLEDFENDILKLAISIDLIHWFKTKKILNRVRKNSTDKESFDDFIKKFEQKIGGFN